MNRIIIIPLFNKGNDQYCSGTALCIHRSGFPYQKEFIIRSVLSDSEGFTIGGIETKRWEGSVSKIEPLCEQSGVSLDLQYLLAGELQSLKFNGISGCHESNVAVAGLRLLPGDTQVLVKLSR